MTHLRSFFQVCVNNVALTQRHILPTELGDIPRLRKASLAKFVSMVLRADTPKALIMCSLAEHPKLLYDPCYHSKSKEGGDVFRDIEVGSFGLHVLKPSRT